MPFTKTLRSLIRAQDLPVWLRVLHLVWDERILFLIGVVVQESIDRLHVFDSDLVVAAGFVCGQYGDVLHRAAHGDVFPESYARGRSVDPSAMRIIHDVGPHVVLGKA